ncbi:MAG: GNAT family N-acetyltransferase, partial [Clostridiales bacterium]|nr:GNAT family N-acetyltransferase [Clostridiales bacterium]
MVTVREYTLSDIPAMNVIWNEIVAEGQAFPQEEELDITSGEEFYSSQSFAGVACDERGSVLGLYILHPNNIGRCGHISNASFAVSSACRGQGVGESLVRHCLMTAK